MSWAVIKTQFKTTWITTLLSLILFTGVTYFLIWAESQTIQTSMALEELITKAESLDQLSGDPLSYEGKVVHVVGPLKVMEPISEPDYNIQVLAVKLRKRVQMYQWIEDVSDQQTFSSNEPADESSKSYWYHKDWRDYIVDSSLFYMSPGHQNPSSMPIYSETHIAENVKIGWLLLGLDVKRKVKDYYEIWSDSRPERGDIKLHSGFYYHGESALEHEVGDLRVHFSYAGREDDAYTAVGTVDAGTLQPYSAKKYAGADPVCILRKGSYTLEELYELERRDHHINTWKYRLLGFVQVFAAACTLHPDWLTILLQSRWTSNNLRRSSRLWANLVLSASYTMLIISVPWFIHKPSFGALALGGALLPLLHYSTLMQRREITPD